MSVTGKKTVLVPYGNIIAKSAIIKIHRNNLPVGGSNNGIT
jgi:hypothetical protein